MALGEFDLNIQRRSDSEIEEYEMPTDETGTLDSLVNPINEDKTRVTASTMQLLRMHHRGEGYVKGMEYVNKNVPQHLQKAVLDATSQLLKLGY